MKTVERQLADYFQSQEEIYGPITPGDVTIPVATVAAPKRTSRTTVLVAAAVAIAVILAIALVAILAPGSGTLIDQTPVTPIDQGPITSTSVAEELDRNPIATSVADEMGASVTFNDRTFRIIDGRPRFQVEDVSPDGRPELRDEFRFDYLPTITATEDRIMVVSPSPGTGPQVCRSWILFVAVSDTGEDFHHTAIDDLGDDMRRQESSPDRRNLRCMNIDQGGDAIGPVGMLIVRVVTRCCVDPYFYPHFWFSPDGVEWERVTLPGEMARIDAVKWGPPRATRGGFLIHVTYDVSSPKTVTWHSSDGRTWAAIEEDE